jgi:hypothetical protein
MFTVAMSKGVAKAMMTVRHIGGRTKILNSDNDAAYIVSPAEGLIRPAVLCPSPNQDERPPGVLPELIIIHGISLPPGVFSGDCIEKLFTNRQDWDAHPYFAEIRGMRESAH